MPGSPKKSASLAKLLQGMFEETLVDYAEGDQPLQAVLNKQGIVMIGWRAYLKEHPEAKAAWDEVKRYGAEALAEASLGIADGASRESTAHVSKGQAPGSGAALAHFPL
ncbi:MAG: hypothetical protein ACT4PM_13710 [Gemmatimonadales bacterium]